MKIVSRHRRLACKAIVAMSLLAQRSVKAIDGPFPFDASVDGAVLDEVIHIKEHRDYKFFLLVFFQGAADRQEVSQLCGGTGKTLESGVIDNRGVLLPLSISLWSSGGAVIIHPSKRWVGGYEFYGFKDNGGGYFGRYIDVAELRPGTYHLKLMTLQDTPAFRGLHCELQIGWEPNTNPIQDEPRPEDNFQPGHFRIGKNG